MVVLDVRGNRIGSAELHVGGTTIRIVMSKPRPLGDAERLERIERDLNDIAGGVSQLFLLWIGASQYERIFLDLLAKRGRVTSDEILDAYRAEGLRHSTGRILAGVTGGITKKLQRAGMKDFWVADYDGEARRWTLNPKYSGEARDTFKD